MSLTAIAEDILAQARTLDAHLTGLNTPASFDNDVLNNLPTYLDSARHTLIDQTYRLRRLAQGPHDTCIEIAQCYTDIMSLNFIYRHRIATHVPLAPGTSTTFAALAAATSIPEHTITRFLRHAMWNFIFREPSAGRVAHTAFSRELVSNPGFADAVGFCTEDITPALAKFPDAAEKWGFDAADQNQTGFQIAFGTDKSFYEAIGSDPARGMRTGGTMQHFARHVFSGKQLLSTFGWERLDRPGSVLVDIGGGIGGMSKVIAGVTRDLRLVVQDMEGTVRDGEKVLEEEFRGRIEFQAGSIFEVPVTRGADAYFLRWILHNWHDKYALQIARNLVPALKPGSKILICKTIPNDERQKGFLEKLTLNMDLVMAGSFNGRVRSVSDWHHFFKQVDERLVIKRVHAAPGNPMGLLEVVFDEPSGSQAANGVR